MSPQNIRLTLPEELLLKVRLIAVRRRMSDSSLLESELEKLVQREDAYDHARRRHIRVLEQGFDLGTQGNMAKSRDEQHERR